MHQRKVSQMIKSADGSAGLLHRITKPTARRGGVKILKEVEEEPGRWIAAKKRGKSGQDIGKVTTMCNIERISLRKMKS